MIESACLNCGGSLFSESYKAEGSFFDSKDLLKKATEYLDKG